MLLSKIMYMYNKYPVDYINPFIYFVNVDIHCTSQGNKIDLEKGQTPPLGESTCKTATAF